MYLPVVKGLRFGHPLAVEDPADDLPVAELRAGHPRQQGERAARALRRGSRR
jgi:hypothetical protein